MSDLLFIFGLAGICGNVADDVVTFSETGKPVSSGQEKKKKAIWKGAKNTNSLTGVSERKHTHGSKVN